jgi:Recombination endonuclease VII
LFDKKTYGREWLRRKKADPEWRAKFDARQKAWRERPEVRERFNRRARERYAADPEYRKIRSQQTRGNHLDRTRKWKMKKLGSTVDLYDTLFEAQSGVCAICKRPETRKGTARLCVDHCHKTGEIRGLLCHRCNMVLGLVEDNCERLQAAIAYLLEAARQDVAAED